MICCLNKWLNDMNYSTTKMGNATCPICRVEILKVLYLYVYKNNIIFSNHFDEDKLKEVKRSIKYMYIMEVEILEFYL
ncbi:hypothetical protein KUTeg_022942 [Tegillarca granosa]|uniref:RING-type domain-containing protein n=1 Tax=Tegillarca granosa TaxID=220873 RepID=A0ABQ9E0V2_TEGGR|nr:hypothetical protein KUTeg_022942 [Tegillarca granosa]